MSILFILSKNCVKKNFAVRLLIELKILTDGHRNLLITISTTRFKGNVARRLDDLRRGAAEFTESRPLWPIDLEKLPEGEAMQRSFVHGVGGVLSADIAVPDHERELDFYSTILTTGDAPLWRDDLMNNLGTPVIGLGVRTPEYENLPLQWMPHFQVADVAACVASAVERGGKELMRSQTDEWAVLADQVGAAFGVIPVVAGGSGSTENERIGCISWLSLTVQDALSSQDFYRHVVGWNAKSIEAEDNEGQFTNFEMQRDNEVAAAEICQYRSEDEGIPSVWLIHLPVDDLVESLRAVSHGGGEVIKEYAEAKFAVVRDPVGAFLALQAG